MRRADAVGRTGRGATKTSPKKKVFFSSSPSDGLAMTSTRDDEHTVRKKGTRHEAPREAREVGRSETGNPQSRGSSSQQSDGLPHPLLSSAPCRVGRTAEGPGVYLQPTEPHCEPQRWWEPRLGTSQVLAGGQTEIGTPGHRFGPQQRATDVMDGPSPRCL
jgi:hypothetical protein